MSPAEPTLTVIVAAWWIRPSAFADTNVWVLVLVEGALVNTLTLKVLVVLFEIVNHSPLTGSLDLGYSCWVLWSFFAQVNVNDLSTNLILSPLENPWAGTVRVNTPVVGLYDAFVTVYAVPSFVISTEVSYAASFPWG